MHVHILGICGTLMGSIALLARAQGHRVTGSDENVYPPMSTQLQSSGIEVATGYLPENIPTGVDMVIVGNANLPRGNPAVEYVLEKGIPYTSGAEWLGRYLLPGKWVIAVAGTHGKTTTTSMVAWILEYAGLAPGFLIGGIPANFPESARLGETDFFVIEADEYDTSYFDRRSKFLHYRPRTAILGNLEFDHADIFPDLEAIKQQFHLLLRTIPASGQVILPVDDADLDDVIARGCWSDTVRFGLDNAAKGTGATIVRDDGSVFDVFIDGDPAGRVEWNLSGEHNVRNGLAAITAARHAGVAPAVAIEALGQFAGVKRRMEVIFVSDRVTLYDDFAHHPTAIRETLLGLRHRVGSERILAVIEPRSHTMRGGYHAERLSASTADADEVFWFQPAGVQWDMRSIERGDVFDDIETMIDRIARDPANHIVIMSNGGFDNLHGRLTERLER